MFRLIAIDFSQKSPHLSLLSPTSPCELSEREVTSPSNLKVVGALDNYSLVFVIFINFFGQLKDWVRQVLFLVSCPKGQVEKYVNVEACTPTYMFNVYKNQLSRQTEVGIWRVQKHFPQYGIPIWSLWPNITIFANNSCWEKCNEKYLGRTEGRTEVKQYTPPPPSAGAGV
jgi:hypothetical protein